ncbi:MAG: metal ABC transporter permease, partial [Mucinivorans sp.]
IAQMDFLQNALLATLLSSISCAIIGTYMVMRRLVFLGGGITHSSFGGIGMAYYFGLNPIMGAMVFAIVSALAIEKISHRGAIREDSAIGILWSLGMAIGIIFIFITPGYAPNLMSFLFGNILMVSRVELLWLFGLDMAIILIFSLFYRTIIYCALDRSFAKSLGRPTRVVGYGMMLLLAITIVVNIKVVGIMMLISLLTIPSVVGAMLSNNYRTITLWAILVALACSLSGLFISYVATIPAGAAAVAVMGGVFLMVKLVQFCTQLFRGYGTK